jgi:hypothetical protein
MSIVYCAECGFQNPEAANYCSRCGSLLARGESSGEITQTFSPEEIADLEHDPVVGLDRTRIGRSPDCEVFLDDVTVSRNHAVLVRQDEGFVVEDQGSLNGTFVNRRRIDSAPLENGDELQIGKYRMTFIA